MLNKQNYLIFLKAKQRKKSSLLKLFKECTVQEHDLGKKTYDTNALHEYIRKT